MEKKKKWALWFAIGTLVFTFLSLGFNVVKMEIIGIKEQVNGFDVMDGNDIEDAVEYFEFIRIFNWAIVGAVVAEACMLGYALYKKDENIMSKLKGIVVWNVVLTLICMINGFIALEDTKDALEELIMAEYGYDSNSWAYEYALEMVEYSTETYIPFLLTTACAIGYFVMAKKAEALAVLEVPSIAQEQTQAAAVEQEKPAPVEPVQDSVAVASATSASAPTPDPKKYNESETVDLLLKYKSLLDQGVITQEEYDKKKMELLN